MPDALSSNSYVAQLDGGPEVPLRLIHSFNGTASNSSEILDTFTPNRISNTTSVGHSKYGFSFQTRLTANNEFPWERCELEKLRFTFIATGSSGPNLFDGPRRTFVNCLVVEYNDSHQGANVSASVKVICETKDLDDA